MSFFDIKNLSCGYGKSNILENINFSIDSGEIVGVLGPNGCGKTTLLKSLCGIIPCKGTVTLNDQDLKALSPKALASLVSYIPQKTGISISMTALDVVLMGFNHVLGLLEYPSSSMKEKAIKALTKVGLQHKIHQDFLTLSQGQMQLCLIARTIVSDSNLLLLDEPESALDFSFRYRVMGLLKDWISEDINRSAVISLHDPNLALNCCDKLALITSSDTINIISLKNADTSLLKSELSKIYGPISIKTCYNDNNEIQLVMLPEQQ